MAESLDNIGGMANTNQQMGSNPIAGLLLGRQFAKYKSKQRGSSGGGQDKQWFENQAELMRHGSQLRMNEDANSANIRDMEQFRSYGGSEETLADGGHIGGKTRAARRAGEIRDAEGNVIGEVGTEEKGAHGSIKTGAYRLPERKSDEGKQDEPTPQGGPGSQTLPDWPGTADRPELGQQMEPIVTSGPRQTFLGAGIPVAIDKINSDRDPDGTFTMGTGPGVRRENGTKGFDFPMRGELDKWKAQQALQDDQHKAHLESTGHPQEEKGKAKGKPAEGKPAGGKADVATPVAEAVGGSIGAGIGAVVGSVAGPVGTAAGSAGGKALGAALGGAIVKKKNAKKTASSKPASPSAKPPTEPTVNS